MNNYLELIEALAPPSQSLTTIFMSFVMLAAYCFCLTLIYKKHRRKYDMNLEATSILALAAVTFLVVVIIQDSITLSLGMVGALSIVRFRTPIKNPYELIYLFAGIGLGVGFGSGKILIAGFGGALVLLGMACIISFARFDLSSSSKSMSARLAPSDSNSLMQLRQSFDFRYIEISQDEIYLEFESHKNVSIEEFLSFCSANNITIISTSLSNQ